MYCEKCEEQDFNLLTGVTSGPVAGVAGVTKSWKIFECKSCGFYKLVREETSEGQHDISEKNT
jgi:hypothetical protein